MLSYVYADERPLLEALLARHDGGGLKIDEGYEGGKVYCRVWFSLFVDRGEGIKNQRLCITGLHESSYQAARHEAVSTAIMRFEEMFNEKIKTCQYDQLRRARAGKKRLAAVARGAEKRQRLAESMCDAAVSAKDEANKLARMAEAAYKEAERGRLAAEATAARDREAKEKVLDELEREHEERISADECLYDVQEKLDEMTEKRDDYLQQRDALEHMNSDMLKQVIDLEAVVSNIRGDLDAAHAEIEMLKLGVAGDDLCSLYLSNNDVQDEPAQGN